MNEFKGPKSFSDELRRMPIDYQRRVRWSIKIATVWGMSVLFGAGVFLLSKPYMDRRREERIKSGEFFQGNSAELNQRLYTTNSSRSKKMDSAIIPPSYLIDVIDQILKEDEKQSEV